MIFDFVVAALLIYGFYRGYSKGFIKSVASFISVFIGAIFALNFSYVAATYLEQWFNLSPKVMPLISFIAVFVLVLFLINIITNLLDKILNKLMLGFVNKLGGGITYAFLFAFLISTVFWFIDKAGFLADQMKLDSLTWDWIAPISPATIATLGEWIPGLDNIFQSFEEFFDGVKETKDKLTF